MNLQPQDLVLCPAYFGFPPAVELEQALRNSAARVVVDAAQALFLPCSYSDWYYLFSLRKWAGLPDGGLLYGPALQPANLSQAPAYAWLQRVYAQILRHAYDLSPTDNPQLRQRWYELYRSSEAAQPTGPFALSDLSRALLRYGLDYTQIRQQRRQNYLSLHASLSELALYPELPDTVVPLGFPIRVKARDRVQARLAAQGIFCPVHWSVQDIIPAEFTESHALSRQILTLPCDQRYGETHMQFLSTTLRKILHDV